MHGGGGGDETSFTSVAVTVRVRLGEPPVPVTVKGYDPAAVVELTVTVMVDVLPLVGLGLKLPVAPEGRLLTDRVTAELNPPLRVIVTV